jgi:class 3 adenylate cyclase
MPQAADVHIRFFTTSDGVRIAYRSFGDGPPLLYVRGWISDLEIMATSPEAKPFFDALATIRTVIQFDMRGNGQSDREAPAFTLDDCVRDIEELVAHLQLPRFDMFAQSFGGPIAIAYAARNPDRLSRLTLFSTYARGAETSTPERHQALVAGIRSWWSGAVRLLDDVTSPDTARHRGALGAIGHAISPDVAAELYDLGFRLDVTGLLPQVTTPTLVLHRRETQAITVQLGRRLASTIPSATFVPLEGSDHNPWSGDSRSVLEAIGEFLGQQIDLPQARTSHAATEASVTILFTDMENSTDMTQRLGDSRAQDVLEAHNQIVRAQLKANRGREIKHTGDGIMASFPAAGAAIQCAIDIQREITRHGEQRPELCIGLRIGLNSGEPVVEGHDLFGTAVQTAARVCAQASAGQILVSNVVRELAAGRGFLFADRGDVALRGLEEPVRLFEVRW